MKNFKKIVQKWMSQADFAKEIGLSKYAINKHLNRGIPSYYAHDYARATQNEITVDDIINADKERRKKDKK